MTAGEKKGGGNPRGGGNVSTSIDCQRKIGTYIFEALYILL